MIELPNIPRLYTALAEVLAVCLYADRLPPLRCGKTATGAITVVWVIVLGAFLKCTGFVPLMWWIPCMLCAVSLLYIYLWGTRCVNWLEALYTTARAFMLAELAASVEWQLHCWVFPHRRGGDPLALLLLVVVYGAVYGVMYWLETSRPQPSGHLDISNKAALVAVVMAGTVFAVSNLLFLGSGKVTMMLYYVRTLVDICGVLILTVQQDQLREAALHKELTALDERASPPVRAVQAEQGGHPAHQQPLSQAEDPDRGHPRRARPGQAGRGLGSMESGILQYEAENKTGNPVLDTHADGQEHGLSGKTHPDDQRSRRPGAEFPDHAGDLHHCGHCAGQRH